MSRLFGYCRVSTDMQETSREAQEATIRGWAEKAGLEVAAVFIDEDVSGSIPLRDRPSGKRMWDSLGRGDTVVITTKDRAFRSLVDAAITVMSWREQGVKLHILDFPVDLSTDEGEMVFLQGAVFSQYERKQIGKRIKASMKHRKDNKIPYGGMRPWGYVRKGNSWVPYQPERDLAATMIAMRKGGISYLRIAFACMNAKKPVVKRKSSPYYHMSDCRSLVRAAEAGFPVRTQACWLRREAGD